MKGVLEVMRVRGVSVAVVLGEISTEFLFLEQVLIVVLTENEIVIV